MKQFISTCSCTLSGQPRKTKHHGDVSRPKDAEESLMYCAGINIHNHVKTGSLGYEDIWLTRNAIHRQFAGITGFLFTNAYLDFKMALSNQMVTYSADMGRIARS